MVKEPWKMKIVVDWIEEKKFQNSFEVTTQEIQEKEPPL